MIRTVSVPTLAGGVSQGLAPLNPPWKVRESVNNVLDIARGAGKRPGSRHVAMLDAQALDGAVWRTLRFEDDQFYLAHITPAGVDVWDRFGTKYLVTAPGASYGYLAQRAPNAVSSPEGDWAISAEWAFDGGGTFTLVGSIDWIKTPWGEGSSASVTRVATASSPSGSIARAYNDSGLVLQDGPVTISVFVKDPNFHASTGVLSPTQVGLGIQKPGGDFSALYWELQAGGGFKLKSQNGEGSIFTKVGSTAVGNGWTRLWLTIDLGLYMDLTGEPLGDPFLPSFFVVAGASEVRTCFATGFHVAFGVEELPPYLLAGQYETLSIGSQTLILNKSVTVQEGATLEPTPTAYGEQAMFFVAQGAFSTKYSITAVIDVGGTPTTYFATINTWNGVNAGIPGNIDSIEPSAIAASLRAQLTGASAASHGPIVLIRSAPGRQILNLSAFDSQGGEVPLLRVFKNETEQLSDLPAVAPNGFKIKIAGNQDFNQDDYYVEFVLEGNGVDGAGATTLGLNTQKYGEGAWIESLPNGLKVDLLATTMPHRLERKIDDSVGTVTGQPEGVYFEWSTISWSLREVGDNESNPFPDFVGYKINHIFWVDGRLGVLSRNNVIFSRVDQPFNFWRETVRTYPASDRIQASAASREYSELLNTVLYYGRVILISSENHWILNINPSLTADNINFVPFVSFESLPGVAPAYTDSSVYVPYKNGAYTGVRRITPSNADANALVTQDVSREIRNYIGGSAKLMVSAVNLGMLFVLTEIPGVQSNPNIYVYSYTQSGSDLVQTAWHRWRTLDTVEHLAVEDSVLYVVQKGSGGVYLEKLVFDDVFAAEGTQEWRLDRRLDVASLGIAASGGKTMFTAPPGFSWSEDVSWKLVYTAASNAPGTFTSSKLKLPVVAAASSGRGVSSGATTVSLNSFLNLKQYYDFKVQAFFYRFNYLKSARYSGTTGWLKEAKNGPGFFVSAGDGIGPIYTSGPEKGYPNIGNVPATDPWRCGTLLFRDLRETSSDASITPLYRAGTYVLTYEGEGQFIVGLNAVPANPVSNPIGPLLAGETSPGSKRIEFNVATPSTAGVYLAVYTSNPANRVRNMRVFYKTDEAALNGQPWLPELISDITQKWQAKGLRPMEFAASNVSFRSQASERVLVTDPFWTGGGVPWEIMADLCNRTNCHLWYNSPGYATSALIEAEATVIRDTLAAGLLVYAEGPNEMFNGLPFATGQMVGIYPVYALGSLVPPSAAFLEGNNVTPKDVGETDEWVVFTQTTTKPGYSNNISTAAFEGAGTLTGRCHTAFNTVFTGQTNRVVFTFGTQAANTFLFDVGISRAPLTQLVVIAPYAATNPFVDFTHPTFTQGALQSYVAAEVDQAVQFVQNFRTKINNYNAANSKNLKLGCYEFGFQIVSGKINSGNSSTFYPLAGESPPNGPGWNGWTPGGAPFAPENLSIGDAIKTFMRSAQAGTILQDFVSKVAPLIDGPLAFYADYALVSPVDGHYALLDYPGQSLTVYPKAQTWATISAGGTGDPGTGPGGIAIGPSDLVNIGDGTLVPGPPVPPGTTLDLTWEDAQTLSIQGNLLDLLDYLQIGAAFDAYVVPHPPFFRNSQESTVLSGAFRSKQIKVAFEDTYRFDVDVLAENLKTYTRASKSRATPTQLVFRTGQEEFPAVGDPSRIVVALHNREVTPNWFASLEWQIVAVRR